MKKILVLLLLMIGTAITAIGQVSYDTVSATITDPDGHPYANAALTANLVNAAGYPVSSVSTPNGQLFNAKQVLATLDAAGHFSIQLVPNNILSNPSGTQWVITITYPQDSAILLYQPPWAINYSLALSAPIDLSSQLSSLAQTVNFVNLKTGQNTLETGGVTYPITVSQGGTGANTAAGALRNLTGANPPILSQITNRPWDDFDAANGTLMQGRVSPSGAVWSLAGAGAATASIVNGGYQATDNTYATLTDGQPFTEAEGVFSFLPPAINTADQAATFIFSSTGNIATGTLLHLRMTSTGWSMLKSVSGGASNLVDMAAAPVELNGIPAAQASAAAFIGSFLPNSLKMDGTKYKIRGVINSAANTLTFYMPDGTVWQYTDPDIGTIGPTMTAMIYQLGYTAGNTIPVWNEVAIGASQSSIVTTSESQDHRLLNQTLAQTVVTSISPTANGWYKIADCITQSINCRLGGTVTIYGVDTADRSAYLIINVGTESPASGTVTASQIQFSVTPYLGTWAAGVIPNVRVSGDNTTGKSQLEIQINTPNVVGANLAAVSQGYFAPVENPVVGSTALTSWGITKSTALPAGPYTATLTGGVGWYNILTAGSCGSYCIAGDYQFQARTSFGVQLFELHIDATTSACTISQGFGTYPGIITQYRCSYDNSTGIRVDGYDNQSATYPVTLTGTFNGYYTANSSPTVGATPLSGGGTPYPLYQTYAPIQLSQLAVQPFDTVVMNATSGSASPTAVSIPDCAGGVAYSHTTHTWTCVTAGTFTLTTTGTSGAATYTGGVLNIPVYSGGTNKWSCQPGLGDGLNAITAGTHAQTTCQNTTGSTVTLSGISCYADSGSSTVNVAAHTLGALLTGAITCSTSWATGTQSANVLLTSGDYLTFTFVADGTTKQSTWNVKGTY